MPYKSKTDYNRPLVYVVYAEALQLVKIGHSFNYERRVKNYSNEYLTPVELWSVYEGDHSKDIEHTLHTRLAPYRREFCKVEWSRNIGKLTDREWFAVDRATVDDLASDLIKVEVPQLKHAGRFAYYFEYSRITGDGGRLKLLT